MNFLIVQCLLFIRAGVGAGAGEKKYPEPGSRSKTDRLRNTVRNTDHGFVPVFRMSRMRTKRARMRRRTRSMRLGRRGRTGPEFRWLWPSRMSESSCSSQVRSDTGIKWWLQEDPASKRKKSSLWTRKILFEYRYWNPFMLLFMSWTEFLINTRTEIFLFPYLEGTAGAGAALKKGGSGFKI